MSFIGEKLITCICSAFAATFLLLSLIVLCLPDPAVMVEAGVIIIDDMEKAALSNKTLAENVLKTMLEDISKEKEYVSVDFIGKVEVIEKNADMEKILELSEAIGKLKSDPDIIIRTQEKVVVEEDIPFKEVVSNSRNLLPGQREIVSRGYPGKKSVEMLVTKYNGVKVAAEVVKESIIKKPVDSKVVAGAKADTTIKTAAGYLIPVFGNISSGYGMRGGRMHQGVDIAAKYGEDIYAADAGTVIFTGWYSGYGNLIRVSHEDGIVTYYGHCSKILVTKGQQVEKGQKIGLVGDTGNSSGPHLHFEVRKNGIPQNPAPYLK